MTTTINQFIFKKKTKRAILGKIIKNIYIQNNEIKEKYKKKLWINFQIKLKDIYKSFKIISFILFEIDLLERTRFHYIFINNRINNSNILI